MIFDDAFDFLMKHEGGYADDPNDSGGATNHGISLRYLKEIEGNAITKEDIQALTLEQAKEIYKKYWWEYYRYDQIQDRKIAIKLFDIAVNIGAKRANKMLQQCLTKFKSVICDGVIGPLTLCAINELTEEQCNYVETSFEASVMNYYVQLANENSKLKEFLNGWLKRASDKIN